VTLRKGRSLEEYRDTLGSCLEESIRLSELIDSLLFLARAESPGTHLTREPVHVVKELAAVRDYYEAVASDADVTLSVAADGEIVADLDRVLLQRAIGNLVENAVAHTPAGGSVILATRTNDGLIYIDVADTGTGIPQQHLPHVFDRFYRADSARSSRGGHMGLGLAIVHAIAGLHGGSIDISSEVGHGTQVTLALPQGQLSHI
jgi:two-component system heavy metal sensor histidine kinase CusS